ncbi:MAG TPA: HisA/HisF-related TIM barrel protein, partial [Dongiaceae bacterium]
MEIIPVIDLMGGIAVHARRGERHAYQPLMSPLSRSSQAVDVVAGYLGIHPFSTIYIADLDAIMGKGDSSAIVGDLRRRFPALRFWVDNGLSSPEDCKGWLRQGLGDLVLGSEAQRDVAGIAALTPQFGGSRIILSLDFKDGQFLGPMLLRQQPELWPQRLIVMTLSRVGSDQGPDVDLLEQLRAQALGKNIFAAGGVRGGE